MQSWTVPPLWGCEGRAAWERAGAWESGLLAGSQLMLLQQPQDLQPETTWNEVGAFL
jgi:hypothetical protein